MGCAGSKLATASTQVAPHSFELKAAEKDAATEQSGRASRISFEGSCLELGWCTRLAGDVAPLRGLVQVTRLTLEGCPGLTGDKKELSESVEAKRKAFAALSNREASFASRGSRVSWD